MSEFFVICEHIYWSLSTPESPILWVKDILSFYWIGGRHEFEAQNGHLIVFHSSSNGGNLWTQWWASFGQFFIEGQSFLIRKKFQSFKKSVKMDFSCPKFLHKKLFTENLSARYFIFKRQNVLFFIETFFLHLHLQISSQWALLAPCHSPQQGFFPYHFQFWNLFLTLAKIRRSRR